jgi:hypothetical protein
MAACATTQPCRSTATIGPGLINPTAALHTRCCWHPDYQQWQVKQFHSKILKLALQPWLRLLFNWCFISYLKANEPTYTYSVALLYTILFGALFYMVSVPHVPQILIRMTLLFYRRGSTWAEHPKPKSCFDGVSRGKEGAAACAHVIALWRVNTATPAKVWTQVPTFSQYYLIK